MGVEESLQRKTKLLRNQCNVPSETPLDHFKKAVAIPLLDSVINESNQRFSEQRHAQGVLCLVPSIWLSTTMNPLDYIEDLMKWQGDVLFPKSLPNELRRWQYLRNSKESELVSKKREGRKDADVIPGDLLQTLVACDADSFPNICCSLLIGCTLPITSSEAERSFSLLRRLKTYSRSVMTEERLSDLAVIAIHYSERIAVEEVCRTFVQEHPRRLSNHLC